VKDTDASIQDLNKQLADKTAAKQNLEKELQLVDIYMLICD
jgi:hypothetical protein